MMDNNGGAAASSAGFQLGGASSAPAFGSGTGGFAFGAAPASQPAFGFGGQPAAPASQPAFAFGGQPAAPPSQPAFGFGGQPAAPASQPAFGFGGQPAFGEQLPATCWLLFVCFCLMLVPSTCLSARQPPACLHLFPKQAPPLLSPRPRRRPTAARVWWLAAAGFRRPAARFCIRRAAACCPRCHGAQQPLWRWHGRRRRLQHWQLRRRLAERVWAA